MRDRKEPEPVLLLQNNASCLTSNRGLFYRPWWCKKETKEYNDSHTRGNLLFLILSLAIEMKTKDRLLRNYIWIPSCVSHDVSSLEMLLMGFDPPFRSGDIDPAGNYIMHTVAKNDSWLDAKAGGTVILIPCSAVLTIIVSGNSALWSEGRSSSLWWWSCHSLDLLK
jgi:hypothetical protein